MASVRDESAVGCRVQVYWEGESEWFEGTVDAYDPDRGYFVKYDDGEEQWEIDAGEHSMKFLSDDGGADAEVSSNEASPREPEDYGEDEYEDDHGNADDDGSNDESANDNNDSSEQSSPRPEQEEAKVPELKVTPKPTKPARAFMRHSAAFFRDEESLTAMRQELRQEKKTLTNQLHTLTMQLTEKEHLSAALKADLHQLKTSATLANVILQHKSISISDKGPPKPKTMAQWSERVLDQKLDNQHLSEELLFLKTVVQNKQIELQRKKQRRDELTVKLGRVPRRHLCTLVDLQVEIARLLDEKRALEAQSPRPLSSVDAIEEATSKSSKAQLQIELTGLEVTAERYKEELHKWELKIDCEQARMAPLESRLLSLQQELRQYEDSQVLLRSVFLRLEPKADDGCVSLGVALAAFQTLAPSSHADLTTEDMAAKLMESSMLSSTDKQQRLSFNQFVETFTFLFKV